MADDSLKVLPVALHAASGIIAGHAARVASSPGGSVRSAEESGVAAGAINAAFHGFCAAFSQRLSSTSTALVDVAGSFSATEDTNRQALASIAGGDA